MMTHEQLTASDIRLVWTDALSRLQTRHEHILSQQLVDALETMGLSTSIATHREALARSTPLQAMSATLTVICLSSKMPCPQYVRAALYDQPRFWEQQMVRRCLDRLLGWRVKLPEQYIRALRSGLTPIMPDEMERATLLDQSRYLGEYVLKYLAPKNPNSYQTPT